MITKERLQEIVKHPITTGHKAVADIAQYLLEQAEKQEAMKPRPRAAKGKEYWYVDEYFRVIDSKEDGYDCDDDSYNSGNYFLTEAEAQAFADKIKELRNTM